MAVNLFPTTTNDLRSLSTNRSFVDPTGIKPSFSKNINKPQIQTGQQSVQSPKFSKFQIESLGTYPSSNFSIIPIWLRDTYARIQPTPIYNLYGPLRENVNTEEQAKELLIQGIEKSEIFLSGANVFGYLNRNLSKQICNQTVTIVIHSLRDLYWNNRHTLPQEVVTNLEVALRDPLPTFKNMFEYESIQNLSESINLTLYQLFGTITPFSVLHIPVSYFIEALNAKVPIQIALENTNIIIQLDYEQYDFWDTISESMVDYVDLQSRCK